MALSKFITVTRWFDSLEAREPQFNRHYRANLYKQLPTLKKARKAFPGRMRGDRYNSPEVYAYEEIVKAIRQVRRLAVPKTTESARLTVTYKRGSVRFSRTGLREEFKELLSSVKRDVHNLRMERRECEPSGGRYVESIHEYVPLVGKVHTEKGYFLLLAARKQSKMVYLAKRPKSDDKHVGIELEFCSPVGEMQLGVMLSQAGLGEHVQLKHDGSIVTDSRGRNAHELCILAKQTEIHALIPRITKVLQEANSYVNRSCGYHVHIDMRGRDAGTAWMNLRNAQPLLYKMVPEERKKNRYCKPVRSKEWDSARRSGNRYYGINARAMRQHNTLEVRLHSATLDPKKILAWVDLLLTIVDQNVTKTVQTVKSLKKQITLSVDLASYMEERIKHFEPTRTNPNAIVEAA